MPSLPSSTGSRSSWSSFSRTNTYEEVLKEYNIKEYSASEFELIAADSPLSNVSPSLLPGPMQTYFAEKELTLGNFIIRELQHYKEARSHSQWEHEFLIAKMYYPNNSEVAGALLIDREQRPSSPDVVRVVLSGDIMHSDLNLLHIIAHLGFRPSNLGRSCTFASPPSVGEIASVLAEKSRAGKEYTVHNHNCYWYAKEVFDRCVDIYEGSATNGPYWDDLGTFMKDTPKTFITNVRVDTIAHATTVVAGIVLGGLTASPLLLGVGVIAVSTCAGILAKSSKLSQAKPLG